MTQQNPPTDCALCTGSTGHTHATIYALAIAALEKKYAVNLPQTLIEGHAAIADWGNPERPLNQPQTYAILCNHDDFPSLVTTKGLARLLLHYKDSIQFAPLASPLYL
jgi:hypothetical protein